jgi:hypothetical protein
MHARDPCSGMCISTLPFFCSRAALQASDTMQCVQRRLVSPVGLITDAPGDIAYARRIAVVPLLMFWWVSSGHCPLRESRTLVVVAPLVEQKDARCGTFVSNRMDACSQPLATKVGCSVLTPHTYRVTGHTDTKCARRDSRTSKDIHVRLESRVMASTSNTNPRCAVFLGRRTVITQSHLLL